MKRIRNTVRKNDNPLFAKELEELQQGFSDSIKPKKEKSAITLISALRLISISQISTQNSKVIGQVFSTLYIARKYRPIGGRLKYHSDQSGALLRIFKRLANSLNQNV